jgi:Zn-dependent M28 family amino/carboxypeptidase
MKLYLFLIIISLSTKAFAQQLIDIAINKDTIKEYVTALAHDSMRGRLSGTKQNILAGAYIVKQFKKIGLQQPNTQGYAQEVVVDKKFYGNNIIGVINGYDSTKRDSLIIFSAHYDHIGGGYNGANDNATGVAAMLSLAQYYALYANNAYTLVFVAFTGEEQGMIGSQFFVNTVQPKLIKYNINLEMLGRPVGKTLRPFYYSAYEHNIVHTLNNSLFSVDSTYTDNYFKKDSYHNQNLYKRSDHYSFNNVGVNAITIMLSSPHDKYYHQKTDETITIDFDSMYVVVKAIALATTSLIE